jgi:transcriptional regulator with XRE-family HTH domain
MKRFNEWLSEKLTEKELSQAELARRAGTTQSAISLVLSENRNPGPEFCEKIARGLKISLEEVYRAAGLLPPKSKADEIIEQAEHIINGYKSPETKTRALAYLEFLRVEEEKADYHAKPARRPASPEPG